MNARERLRSFATTPDSPSADPRHTRRKADVRLLVAVADAAERERESWIAVRAHQNAKTARAYDEARRALDDAIRAAVGGASSPDTEGEPT